MASNRAIMPRADSTSSTVGRSDAGLPSPRTSFQTMTDRPAVILADGFDGFLTKDDFVSLLIGSLAIPPRDGPQQLHKLGRLGQQGRPRHPVGRRRAEVSRR
jgi:hypothetical protein